MLGRGNGRVDGGEEENAREAEDRRTEAAPLLVRTPAITSGQGKLEQAMSNSDADG